MAQRDQRPPRAARPASTLSPTPPHPTRQSLHSSRPQSQHLPPPEPQRGISFQDPQQSARLSKNIDPQRQRTLPSPYLNSPPADAESGNPFDNAKVLRKKSLVRPDREKISPGHRQWYYRSHVAQLENDGPGRVGVRPSSTGNYPHQGETLQRGRSILGREEDVHESGLALFRRGTNLRRKRHHSAPQRPTPDTTESKKRSGCLDNIGPGPKGPWMAYCFTLTCFVPPFLLRSCGILSPEQQRAWREKMGMIGIILLLMAGVGFLTFGFTEAVCGTPPKRFHGGQIANNSVIIHGYDYDFSKFKHPRTTTVFNGQTNPLLEGGWNLAGNDASFLFQNVNRNCLGLITKASNSSITGAGNTLNWYFPCNIYDQHGTGVINMTGYDGPRNCHVGVKRGQTLNNLRQGQVYYTWDDVHNRNLTVFESTVLDLNLLRWLNKSQVKYPAIFDRMTKIDGTFNRKDITMTLYRTKQRAIGRCLQDIVTVGFIDTNSIGCVASQVVLYLSLVFIVGVVAIRFVMAVMFQWFFSWRLGNFPPETYELRQKRAAEIENWTDDIYRPAPSQYRPNVSKTGLRPGKEKRKTFFPSHSRFTPSENVPKGGNSRSPSAYGILPSDARRNTLNKGRIVSDLYRQSRSTMSFPDASRTLVDSQCPFPLQNVVPQPPSDWEPFNFSLVHTICLVTAYSESEKGLRTTLDSLCTTDYPNSHKVILIISDGMVKGENNTLTTPEICLGMMKDFAIPPNEVEPHSYVAIADGHKRHNMAKVYAGFYRYDDSTVERSKQQRVPIVLVAKVGNPLELSDPKPGNRGKRDSQIILMAFLQKVMFDERMTTFEYEFFNSLWRVTGISPDRYELVLCVDADTKVFPDSMTRMVSCMVHDEEIMGLCGETKIANKADAFVTMMQVFEYYISHHMTKAFESMFGGVTCLPGCFSMYRIKAPKGDNGYWVPILANPDIVEHYSENVVDTLHKKNLLLLGEDRYLTTLMLKTFPKRKNMFCPQAVCKTVVPDTFRVLISQRRRWINSTIHNLAELLLVRDLCGTFCFSMQFIVGMELAGTLVLPAAICFTLYLIIRSAIPGHTNTIIPLILLGIVLGLPGLLIVVTSRKLEYIGWMLVYLISLPIWNGILPLYAFWHFDDFSWGQTRRVAGEKTGNEGDKEGEFDSSHIVMKRWAEFERDRRWKNGSHSRESTFYEKRGDNHRYSLVSDYTPNAPTWESSTLESAGPMPRARYDSNAVLMLPAPLAASPQPGLRNVTSSSTMMGAPRSSPEEAYMTEVGSGSRTKLIPTPQMGDQYSDSHDSATTLSPTPTSPRASVPNFSNVNVRNPSSPHSPDGQSQYRHSISGPIVQGETLVFPSLEESFSAAGPSAARGSSKTRGVQLTDGGPTPGPEGVRRVSRPSGKRPTSQLPLQNRYSYALPPGAAAPQPQPPI